MSMTTDVYKVGRGTTDFETGTRVNVVSELRDVLVAEVKNFT